VIFVNGSGGKGQASNAWPFPNSQVKNQKNDCWKGDLK